MEKVYSIIPLNESAALVSFGNVIDGAVNQKVIALHTSINHKSFKGFVESAPAYSSLAVFYNAIEIMQSNRDIKSTFDFVKGYLEDVLARLPQAKESENNRVLEIPVFYNGEDLKFLADEHGLSVGEVIGIHASKSYRVFMVGFLPGFPYMGTVDDRIATARKKSPRTSVPAGSVGIAGYQTGIYPQASPGGWQLIGQTPFKVFDKEKSNPCLLNPGDHVRFYSISQTEFEKLNEY
ncbi:MAG TPA: 5-oxoprolinase subunit PxpB [Cyclobacteriaceae bacterium]|nr:5-oxoprolinase subunit PxpB [Cyclobacteriaceae bacterium]